MAVPSTSGSGLASRENCSTTSGSWKLPSLSLNISGVIGVPTAAKARNGSPAAGRASELLPRSLV